MVLKENATSCPDTDHFTFTVALAGNPNVGKNVVFHSLVGRNHKLGVWRGTNVEKPEGTAHFGDYLFNIVDLPSVYSLSSEHEDKLITREFFFDNHPDYIINIVDANHLERNLYFTLQLLMLNIPMIVALNQYDILKERGYEIDLSKLSLLLGIPVVPVVAIHSRGVHELLETIIKIHEKKLAPPQPASFPFGKEVEQRLTALIQLFQELFPNSHIPLRFTIIKLLKNDQKYLQKLNLPKGPQLDHLMAEIQKTRAELEKFHGESIVMILDTEVYNIANRIQQQIVNLKEATRKQRLGHIFDHITLDPVWGYIFLFVVMMGIYTIVFIIGDLISDGVDTLFDVWTPAVYAQIGGDNKLLYQIIWVGCVGGLFMGVGGILPFIMIFYFFILLLEDIGYMPRAAYLMDNLMHRIGVHGKTIIPMLLGFGCNVAGITASSIMDTNHDKKRAILMSNMMPCSAVTTIVLGLVAKYLGIGFGLLLYLVNFATIVFLGKIFTKFHPCEESELIIELHDFSRPNFPNILRHTWASSKDFFSIAIPLIIVFATLMQVLMFFNALDPINLVLSPITVILIGLPIGVGVYLFYGMLKKELNLILLQVYLLSINLTVTEYMTPLQIILFTLFTMLYVPCIPSMILIKKVAGGKFAAQVFGLKLVIAVIFTAALHWIFEILTKILPILIELEMIGLTFLIFFGLLTVLITIWNKMKITPKIEN